MLKIFLGGYSSVVERQIVDLVVVGSNPITHPFFLNREISVPVAQLDRASDFESAGRTFESCQAHLDKGLIFSYFSIYFMHLTK